MPLIDLRAGTPESAWAESDRLRELDAWQLDARGSIVVLTPHPDDETLGMGGTLHQLARCGEASIRIVALTDGEASHPNSPSHTRADLAALRAREQAAAIARLGLQTDSLLRLHLPDGTLRDMVQLDALLSPLFVGASCCFAPYSHDGHPDHDAAGAAAIRLARAYGVPLWTYPIWAWHWADPRGDELPWERARRVQLDPAAHSGKAAAIRTYQSQIAPLSSAPGDEALLSPDVLAHFARDYEVLFS